MTRKNIFEIINSQYDVSREIQIINNLFSKEGFVEGIPFVLSFKGTIEQFVDGFAFHEWKSRSGCISCEDMRKRLDIATDRFLGDIYHVMTSLEYFYNIKELVFSKGLVSFSNKLSMAFENMDSLLDKLNYQKIVNREEERVYLVPKDAASTAVAEISSKYTAFAILKYNHASLKGDVNEKRNLLKAIALEYETLFKKPIDGYNDLFNAITNALNNLNIRHNNIDERNKNYKSLVKSMSAEKLEQLYDELYQMMLFAVLANDNKKRLSKMQDILKKISAKDSSDNSNAPSPPEEKI